MSGRRGLAVAALLAVLLAVPRPAGAQEALPSAILTIDQDRLFIESRFGKASRERELNAARALEAENARIEADLVAEEQELTRRRSVLPADEFSALATTFDEKVVRIRAEQDAKARDLARARDGDRQEFFRAVAPLLGDLLVERQAALIIDKSATIISLTAIDVTDAAIARVDAALGSGAQAEPAIPSETSPSP
jgi:Skp family chaperone for outer membrane proteins